MQGGAGISAPGAAAPGGSVNVRVGTNDGSVESNSGGSGTQSHEVPPSKSVPLPIPVVPPGTMIAVSVGKGLRQRVILIEVISPGP